MSHFTYPADSTQNRRILTGVSWIFVAAGLAAGCGARSSEGYTPSAGSLALSQDNAFLYAAESDRGVVVVLDPRTRQVVAEVPVGVRPQRVLVGPDDRVYVSNQGSRSVSVIQPGKWSSPQTIAVGVEPSGLAISGDGRTLYVVNATGLDSPAFGTLMAIDTRSLSVKWELPVGEEPRGVVLLDGQRALVSLLKQGDVVMVDLAHPKVTQSGTDLYRLANRSTGVGPIPKPSPGGPTRSLKNHGMRTLAVTPDGKRVFAPMSWSAERQLFDSTGSGGFVDGGPGVPPGMDGGFKDFDGGPGGCSGYSSCDGRGSVVQPGLVTFDAVNGAALVDDLGSFQSPVTDRPPTLLNAAGAVQGPVEVVVDPTGAWIFLLNRESKSVAVLAAQLTQPNNTVNAGPASMPPAFGGTNPFLQQTLSVGAGASGIALSRDGHTAYVHNAFDHTVNVIQTLDGALAVTDTYRVGVETLTPVVAAGRGLFFDATDARMTQSGTGISCSSCHFEGREDGHVWNFEGGPRQTPSLAGRMTGKTAPYHWSGEFADLSNFMDHTIKLRMGGVGLNPEEEAQVAAFIESMPAPDNASRHDQLTPAQVRGAQVFQVAQCGTCHAGAALTNNAFAHVGTMVTQGPVLDDPRKLPNGFNVPSLLGIGRTAPYLHDGSALTLTDRIMANKSLDQHGKTSQLTDAQVNDLVAYLETL